MTFPMHYRDCTRNATIKLSRRFFFLAGRDFRWKICSQTGESGDEKK